VIRSFEKSILSSNGYIISAGATETYYDNKDQILLLMVDPNTKEKKFEQVMGESLLENHVIDLLEDDYSRIVLLCEGRIKDKVSQNWIDVRDENGDYLDHIVLSNSYSLIQIYNRAHGYDLFVNKNGTLLLLKLNQKFEVIEEIPLQNKDNGFLVSAKVFEIKDRLFLFGIEGEKKDRRGFIKEVVEDRIVNFQYFFEPELLEEGDLIMGRDTLKEINFRKMCGRLYSEKKTMSFAEV